tara:strand:+ start:391 stop:933 length:543 start_codon:yes stop_codon:yes gene_type:complete
MASKGRPRIELKDSKLCTSCDKTKETSCFFKDKRSKSGLQTKCKECSKYYYLNNRDHYRNIKKKAEYKETVKKYFSENKNKINEYKRDRYSTEDGKAKVKAVNQNRRALKITTSDGSVTGDFIVNLLKKQDYKCAISGVSIVDDYHVDHIIPLSKGGKHISSNIQLLNPSVNMSKKDKIL